MNNLNSLKRLFIILSVTIGASISINAQGVDSSDVNSKNAIYFELVGHGGLYSLNYERVFDTKRTLRAGVSYLNDSDSFLSFHYLSIPISVSELLPIDRDSFLEIGMFNSFFYEFDVKRLSTWIGPSLGFREQDLSRSRGMVKLFVSPFYIIGGENKFGITAGLAFGSAF